MAQREGSVYLYLFIATFVLFVGGVVAAILENAQVSELRTKLLTSEQEKKTANDLARKNNEELGKLREIFAGPKAKENWPQDEFYVTKIKEAQDTLNELFKKWENKAPKSYDNIVDAYADYKDLVTKLDNGRLQSDEIAKRAQEQVKLKIKENDEDVKRKEEQIGELKNRITETESRYEKKVSDVTKDNQRLQTELAAVKDQLASETIDWQRKLQLCENVSASRLTRLNQLQEEQRKMLSFEDVDPDGKIVQVASSSQIGWVDIGRKNHLRPNLEFRVFQNVKGGKRQYKGRVQIRRVDESISEFRIVETYDELNPITQGDFITSPFYDPKATPVFVFAGEGLDSKEVTEETLRTKIKAYGAEIRNEVDLKTSFVIALKGYEKTQLYKDAREMGVAILRERDVLDYMGY